MNVLEIIKEIETKFRECCVESIKEFKKYGECNDFSTCQEHGAHVIKEILKERGFKEEIPIEEDPQSDGTCKTCVYKCLHPNQTPCHECSQNKPNNYEEE